MGITQTGLVTALKKEGSGSLDPESVFDMMEVSKLCSILILLK